MSDFCRFRDESYGHLCGAPAEMIVWGKLFPPDALGPRCYEHAAKQIGRRMADDRTPGLAIYRFPAASAPSEEAR